MIPHKPVFLNFGNNCEDLVSTFLYTASLTSDHLSPLNCKATHHSSFHNPCLSDKCSNTDSFSENQILQAIISPEAHCAIIIPPPALEPSPLTNDSNTLECFSQRGAALPLSNSNHAMMVYHDQTKIKDTKIN